MLTVYFKRLQTKFKYLSIPRKTTASIMSCPCSKKEVFQPHLPVRLPCYDLAPITAFALGRSFRSRTSGATGFHGLTGGVYKARERIQGIVADTPLLAIPASCSRVAGCNPNWGGLSGLEAPRGAATHCTRHCSTFAAPGVGAIRT